MIGVSALSSETSESPLPLSTVCGHSSLDEGCDQTRLSCHPELRFLNPASRAVRNEFLFVSLCTPYPGSAPHPELP